VEDHQAPGEVFLPSKPSDSRAVEGYCEFFQKEYQPVVRFLLRVGATWEEAEDAAQEAMIRAHRTWLALDHPPQWIRKVAWRCYINSVQRERKRRILEAEAARMHREDSHEYDRLIVEHNWLIEILRDLPPRQREILAWSLDGYKPQEIAHFLDMGSATVRSNLRAIRTKLRTSLPAKVFQADELDDDEKEVK
jgi:RNA polymerase sigma factor (sigma-70 family)